MIGLFIFLLVTATALSWWQLVRAREKARHAASATCRQHGLVLMDDTVMLEGIDTRQWRGKRMIGIRYRFDFAQNGILKHGGRVLIAPRQQALVVISTDQGQLIEVI